ncbi:MAG: prepilin-type N-terminal cleavage/methylation domain-containing protein [Syntrophaceae bacterium]|nr:prepilin-type N-terminal cleavage/methylation domain-containing protein [Syntrophaceae bacterium]
MYPLPCNKSGFTLVEVIIAIFITVVAVLAIFSLMSPAWRTTTFSDQLGRAANILHDQLQEEEALIMNPCNSVTEGTTGPTSVNASGYSTAQPGDAQFSITRTITEIATNVWRVTIRVDWPGHTGISESLVVTRQENYRFPAGCTSP